MQLISLFSGIGGFELAAEKMGWQNIVSCEIEPFNQRVLKYYWPKAYHHGDIYTLNYEKINEETAKRFGKNWRSKDVILTGGFPCQPYSVAGKRKGKNDERHLWPEMLRIIREVSPTWIVGENVLGIVNWNGGMVFDEVQADLEAEGYEVQAFVLPAAGVNAPHQRYRVWFVAYSDHKRGNTGFGKVSEKDGKVPERNDNAEFSNTGNEFDTDTNKIRFQKTWPEQQSTGFARKSIQQPTPNTESIGGSERFGTSVNGEKRENSEHFAKGSKVRNRDTSISGTGVFTEDVMHANGTIKQRQHIKKQRETKFNAPDCGNEFNNFENFPTQSPVCNGDDGLSSRLDGITFPEWRNESIKAGGNAIVPQVAYQIFKAIEEYNKLLTKNV